MSKEPKRNMYVGHRYVPKIMGEWDKAETYEGLSIVTNKGTSYTSKKRVPKGIDILNEEYWVVTGNYNAQIEEYREDVRRFDGRITDNTSLIHSNKEDVDQKITGIENDIDQKITGIENDIETEVLNLNNSLDEKASKNDLETTNKNIEEIGFQVVWNEHLVIDNDWTEAIQNALDHHDTIIFPNKELTITKPLHFTGNKKLIGKGVGNTIITKKGNETLDNGLTFERYGKTYNYDDYDAILLTTGYTGEITIKDIEFRGDKDSPNDYGLLFPHTYRMNLNDLLVLNNKENIRFFMTWNTNIKKVRSRFSTYGIRVEGDDENPNDPRQSTSIHFDNTFAEYCSFGYKLVNVTYFTGSAMSADYNDEVCYWFDFSSGSLNGVGIESSKGQFVRNWRSNVSINGMFLLNNIKHQGLNAYAKSRAKFEVWSSNRNNTGLVVTSVEGRNGLSGSGDSIFASVDGNSMFLIMNSNITSIMTATNEEVYIGKGSSYNNLTRGTIDLKGYYRSIIGDINLNNELIGYNIDDENINNVDGFIHVNTASGVSTNTITIPLSEIKKRFPNFANDDSYLSMPIKVNIVYGTGQSIIDNYIRNKTYIGEHQKGLGTSATVTSIDVNSENVVINLSENISRYKIFFTLP